MDQLGAIRVFVAVAEHGSLSAARRRLHMPLTTVSRQLAALEGQLGLRLITRTTRRLTLTEAGRRYLEVCRHVLDQLQAVERRLAGEQEEPQGELALTAPVVFGRLHVLPIVAEFLDAFPRVRARMLLLDRVVDLLEEGIDVAMRVGALSDSSLIATRLGTIGYVTCASPSYLEEHGAPAVPQDLAEHSCISFATLSTTERWTYAGPKKQQSISLRSRLIVNTAEAAIDAATYGLGIARVFSYQAASGLADGSLRLILEDFEPEAIPVSLVHREDRLPQTNVQSFVAFAVPRMRKQLQDLNGFEG